MANQPEIEVILDLEVKIYRFHRHLTAWHKATRIGTIEHDGSIYQIPGETEVFANRREALERLVRLWRISNPVNPDIPYERKAMNVLGEEIWVHPFRLTPDLAVWTSQGGFPLGTLRRCGSEWARGCSDEAKTFVECLEDMVREFHAERAAQGVSVV